MADDRLLGNTPTTYNLLTANQFKFSTSRVPILSQFVTGVNIPSIEFISTDLKTAYGVNYPIGTGKYIFSDLTVSFLVDEELESWREIYEWIRRLGPMNDDSEEIMYENCYDSTTTAELIILNKTYQPNFKFVFYNFFPIALTGFSFTTTAADSLQISSAATFRFLYYDLIKL
jgi:hypothetical protein